jgi:hypothetical protein
MHPAEMINSHSNEEKASPANSGEKLSDASRPHGDPEKLGGEISHISTHVTMPDLSQQATAERDPHLGKGTPSKQQWKLFQSNANPFKAIALDLWIPWKLFAFPIVEFAAFVVQLFLDHQPDAKSELRCATVQLQQPEHRFHELCHPRRRFHWAWHGWTAERLGQREGNEKEWRSPRA